MGRVVTRSQEKAGSNSQEIASSGVKTNSEQTLSSTQNGRISKKKKKRSMSKRDSTGSNLDVSVLSLDDTETFYQEASTSKQASSSFEFSPTEPTTCADINSQPLSPKSDKPECSICLQTALQPVKLPCNHIFCFLCIKGAVHNGTNSCALCRAPLPRNYILHPEVINESSSSEDNSLEEVADDKWYYEGRNGGWWEFDVRTAQQIEDKYNEPASDEPKILELMIAGFIFIIDLDAMCQRRKDNPHIQRRLKRDKQIADKKGVAGIVKPRRHNNSRSRGGTPV